MPAVGLQLHLATLIYSGVLYFDNTANKTWTIWKKNFQY